VPVVGHRSRSRCRGRRAPSRCPTTGTTGQPPKNGRAVLAAETGGRAGHGRQGGTREHSAMTARGCTRAGDGGTPAPAAAAPVRAGSMAASPWDSASPKQGRETTVANDRRADLMTGPQLTNKHRYCISRLTRNPHGNYRKTSEIQAICGNRRINGFPQVVFEYAICGRCNSKRGCA
jgi:hypothetical protein